mmetsp:Transcript_41417/g.86938  ORF Transcript_41417/g.86938 Transcript_41417/m.86938 type:complete len:227 (+) Transcript_41417:1323-2003(+)
MGNPLDLTDAVEGVTSLVFVVVVCPLLEAPSVSLLPALNVKVPTSSDDFSFEVRSGEISVPKLRAAASDFSCSHFSVADSVRLTAGGSPDSSKSRRPPISSSSSVLAPSLSGVCWIWTRFLLLSFFIGDCDCGSFPAVEPLAVAPIFERLAPSDQGRRTSPAAIFISFQSHGFSPLPASCVFLSPPCSDGLPVRSIGSASSDATGSVAISSSSSSDEDERSSSTDA